jgi:hypothetical protein
MQRWRLIPRRRRPPEGELEFFWMMREGKRYSVTVVTPEGRTLTAVGTFVRYEHSPRSDRSDGRDDKAVIQDDSGTEVAIPKGIADQAWVRRQAP